MQDTMHTHLRHPGYSQQWGSQASGASPLLTMVPVGPSQANYEAEHEAREETEA